MLQLLQKLGPPLPLAPHFSRELEVNPSSARLSPLVGSRVSCLHLLTRKRHQHSTRDTAPPTMPKKKKGDHASSHRVIILTAKISDHCDLLPSAFGPPQVVL